MINETIKEKIVNELKDRMKEGAWTTVDKKEHLAILDEELSKLSLLKQRSEVARKLFNKNPRKSKIDFEYELDEEYLEIDKKLGDIEFNRLIQRIDGQIESTELQRNYLKENIDGE